MKIAPFYSTFRGLAVEDSWHDNDECPIARSIAKPDRLAGKDHFLKHCPICVAINAPLPSRPREW